MSELLGRAGTRESRTIVVGVDGSTTSIDALRWAARQAELTVVVMRGEHGKQR